VRALGALGPLAVALVVLPAAGAVVLVATAGWWQPWLEGGGLGPLLWFTLAASLLCAASLLPTHAASLVGGLTFGPMLGTAAALLSVTAASWLGFVALRTFARERFQAYLDVRPRARAVHDALTQRTPVQSVLLIALVRLSPVMPFAATNLLLAAVRTRPWVFLLGSVLGLAPRVVAVAVAGAGLGTLDLSRGGDVTLLIVGGVATLLALAIMGELARRALAGFARASS